MKTVLFATAAAILALAGPAAAQRGPGGASMGGASVGGGASITLFEAPNYQGPSRTFSADVQNMADQGFNDRAQSARVQGRWRVCEDSRLRGRCVELSGDVPDLAQIRLTVAISSIEDLNRRGGGPSGGYGGGGYGQGGPGGFGNGPGGGYGGGPRPNPGPALEGRTASFFPNPPAGPYRNADDFCRRMGFSGVIYADDRGQMRDVLCRR